MHKESTNSNNNMVFNEERLMIKPLQVTKMKSKHSEDLVESLEGADKVKNNQNQLNAKVKSKNQKKD